MSRSFDVVIVGSGAGAGPVAYTLAHAGYSVLVLEKGGWLNEKTFAKDELACCRRSVYTPELEKEYHLIEEEYASGWEAESTRASGWDFWNGNLVGGSSNLMSGYFYRLKPIDFRLLSEFGPIEGANLVDWPISYAELEPYYTQTEQLVGISGEVTPHAHQEPRSTPQFPYPRLAEHPISGEFDKACQQLGMTPLATPRAILSQPKDKRGSCYYSGYCGSYGCNSGAKGSARAALLDQAVATGNCQIWPRSKVFKLETDAKGRISQVNFYDALGVRQRVSAKIYVVACQAIETSRLLLSSVGSRHPDGLGNHSGQLGKNLLFSAGGTGSGIFDLDRYQQLSQSELLMNGPFVNRGLQDWYVIEKGLLDKDHEPVKGGIIDFLWAHPNPIRRAMGLKWGENDRLVWGQALKQRLKQEFTRRRKFSFEVFNDWLPNDNCYVDLAGQDKDAWGDPVAKVRVGYHPHDLKVGEFLAEKGAQVLKQMGAEQVRSGVSGSPPPNLQAGGCRFGDDPATSVLDRDCRCHTADNLFVTDGSFMPTGGSVPYTWTIYANAFRVADKIKAQLGAAAATV